MYFRRGVFYETPHIVNYIDKELQPLFREKILYGVKQIYRGEKEYKKHFGAGCSKALSCQKVCPAGIETITSIMRMNRK